MSQPSSSSRHGAKNLTLVLLAAGFISKAWSQGAIIWNGPTITYTQPAPDPTQPANQDRLTADVWLTRGVNMGLFNAAQEGSYTHFFSPANTEWANGFLTNYASLTYHDWETWTGGVGNVPTIVGRPAVVHLISDNIYFAITFDSWGVRGPGFSYDRSTPAPEPGFVALLGVGLLTMLARGRLRTRPRVQGS